MPREVTIGPGLRVPYPEPTSAAATAIGKANRRRGTKAERELSSALFRRGLRYRRDLLIRCGAVRVHPDFVFTRARVVIFVDGCFWHRCSRHVHLPKSNLAYWIPKLQANVDRDALVNRALTAGGWTVVRVWEHEDPEVVADRIAELVRPAADPADQDLSDEARRRVGGSL